MPEPTLKSLGLTRIRLGLGDQPAFAGRGYQIVRITHRYWRLKRVGGEQVATAGTRAALLVKLAALLEEEPRG